MHMNKKEKKLKKKKRYEIKFRKITVYPEGKEVPGEWQFLSIIQKYIFFKRQIYKTKIFINSIR